MLESQPPFLIFQLAQWAFITNVWLSAPYILRSLVARQMQEGKETERHLQEALRVYPEDQAAQFLLKQILRLQQQNLPDDWDGAINLDEK